MGMPFPLQLCPSASKAMCGKAFTEAIWSQLDWVRRSLVLQWGLWLAQTAAELCKRPRPWGEGKSLLPFQRISSSLCFLSSLRFLLLWRSQFSQIFLLIIHRQGQGQYHRIWALSWVIKISLRSRQLQQQQWQLPRLRPWRSPELHIKRGLILGPSVYLMPSVECLKASVPDTGVRGELEGERVSMS